MADPSPASLTPRQLEVLELMAKGLRNREIADVLGISAATVKRHVSAVIEVLEVTNRTEAAMALQDLWPGGEPPAVPAEQRVPGFGDRPAIAVLPFDNLSTDPEQEYLADGIVEDLTTRLAQLRWLPVIARNSTFTYKGRAVDVKQVGRELGARYVLEGSVRRSGDRVRVTAQLLDGTSGEHVFADRHEADLKDLFALEDEIVQRLFGVLAPALGRVEGQRALRRETPDLTAWECMMRAGYHLSRLNPDDLRQALPHIERAIELDPHRAFYPAALALYHMMALVNQTSDDSARTTEEMLAFSRRAVALEEDDATAQQMLGWALGVTRDTSGAIAAFERAIELNPSLAWSHWGLGTVLANLPERRAEAVACIEKAKRLSPRDLFLYYLPLNLAFIRMLEGDFDAAQQCIEESRDIDPELPHAHAMLALCHVAKGRLEEARAEVATMRGIDPAYSPTKTVALFVGEQMVGAVAAALDALGFEG